MPARHAVALFNKRAIHLYEKFRFVKEMEFTTVLSDDEEGVTMFSTCRKVNEWMSEFNGQWGIAGGWAIDIFIGKETRLHSDIEIALFREDQHVLKKALPDWSFEKVEKGELISWKEEWLELPVHEIHGVHKHEGERLEVLLNEMIGWQVGF